MPTLATKLPLLRYVRSYSPAQVLFRNMKDARLEARGSHPERSRRTNGELGLEDAQAALVAALAGKGSLRLYFKDLQVNESAPPKPV